MANIAFQIISASSHLYASFSIAEELQNNGHNIIYIDFGGRETRYRQIVIASGYDFYSLRVYEDEIILEKQHKWRYFFTNLLPDKVSKIIKYRLLLLRELMWGNRYEKLKEDLEVDLMIIDSFFSLHALQLMASDIKVVLYQSMIPSEQVPLIPPLNSKFIPWRNNVFYQLVINVLWLRTYLKKRLSIFSFFGLEDRMMAIKIAKHHNIPLKELSFQRAFHIGFKHISELVITPRAFNFSGFESVNNKHYIGPVVKTNRKDLFYDWNYDKMKDHPELLKGTKKVIYCSLGSISTDHIKLPKIVAFFQKVILALTHSPEYILILSIGNNIDYSYFQHKPQNVHIFQTVPQIDVLTYIDLIIGHGGLQSIMEAILYEVPMIVYPLNAKWDQNGNSARVIYHGLGLNGSISSESVDALKRKIKIVINDPMYKRNVQIMKEKMLMEKRENQMETILQSVLNDDLVSEVIA